MEQSTAQRRLAKSPPELWAQVSTTVAWEGDRASGTVELAPAGWETKVVRRLRRQAPAAEIPAPGPPIHDPSPPTPAPDPMPPDPGPVPAPDPTPPIDPVPPAPEPGPGPTPPSIELSHN